MSDNIPAWAIEPVHLEPYDPQWSELARVYERELIEFIGHWLLKPIEHVGSTSIPGLIAKPVIDLQAIVADMDHVVERAGHALRQRGWELVPPELDERPWRRLFVKVSKDGKHRLAHLHLVNVGSERWDQQIAFRDALRKDDALRDEYADIKRELAAAHGSDRERYTAEKAKFILQVLDDLKK